MTSSELQDALARKSASQDKKPSAVSKTHAKDLFRRAWMQLGRGIMEGC
jgi:hypothetical protein